MGRRPKSKSDYIRLGKKMHLTLVDKIVPGDIGDPVQWQCDICGNYTKKSYRRLAYANRRPCPCRSGEYVGGKWVEYENAE